MVDGHGPQLRVGEARVETEGQPLTVTEASQSATCRQPERRIPIERDIPHLVVDQTVLGVEIADRVGVDDPQAVVLVDEIESITSRSSEGKDAVLLQTVVDGPTCP